MRVGVTGHQDREGADWAWTGEAIRRALSHLPSPIEGWSSLAVGADQLFARTVLELGGTIVTVVPGAWYDGCFEGDGLRAYHELLARGTYRTLEGLHGEDAFLQAGLKVAGESEMLIAVWDGEPARGKGGTADVVAHAVRTGKRVLRIDPVARRVEKIGPGAG
ncbi:MAG: hypothetical protein PGN23_06840 [Sphingomonas adhaesiva]|uniref:hypothetical protein n=1 Tax=Sphingomonas adhaesiva TaxID=28212 RepID=UPI002FF4624E